MEEDIEDCDCEQYSAVIMFGLDSKLKDRIRIDVPAQTEFGTRDTVWDVSAMSEMFDLRGVSSYVSKRPTTVPSFSSGTIPFGYMIDEDQNYQINPAQAQLVIEMFRRYAGGEWITNIIEDLNARCIRTSKGNRFNKNSLARIFSNRKCIERQTPRM